jgi:hypothetical protein
MYTFDYKDEHYRDPESEGCGSAAPDEMTETLRGEHQTSPATAADDQEDCMSDCEEDQPALFSSIRVYAIADKYDIPQLKELARERFSNWAEDNWACESFPAIAREVFKTTPTKDRGLRDVVVRLVAIHADDFIGKENSRQLIEDIGDLGLSVLCQLLKKHSKEKSGLKTRLKALEAETAALNAQVKDCERDLRRKSDEMNVAMSKINSLVECRQCKNELNVEVEASMFGGPTVRCKRCRTRH